MVNEIGDSDRRGPVSWDRTGSVLSENRSAS